MEKKQQTRIEKLKSQIKNAESAIQSYKSEISRTQDLIDLKKTLLAKLEKNAPNFKLDLKLSEFFKVINRFVIRFINYFLNLIKLM